MNQIEYENAAKDAIEEAADQLDDEGWKLFLVEIRAYMDDLEESREPD